MSQKDLGTFKDKMNYKKIISHNAEETINLAKKLAQYLKKKDLICLFGDLGSGKTVFVKGIAEGLGIKSKVILSPSFVLIREYKKTNGSFYHLDLYRLKSYREIYSLGYEEYLYPDGITVIEWADRIENLLPKNYLRIELLFEGEKKRQIKLIPLGERYKKLLRLITFSKS